MIKSEIVVGKSSIPKAKLTKHPHKTYAFFTADLKNPGLHTLFFYIKYNVQSKKIDVLEARRIRYAIPAIDFL